jgi:phosphotransferase family enzyme
VQHENCLVARINRRDSFHDCWANVGTLIQMKDSIQSVIAPGATGSSHILAARRRVAAMGASAVNPMQPPTVFELEEALGEQVRTCEPLGRNWRNRVYRVQLATGTAALAKQVVTGTDAMLQCQYDQLGALATLQIPGLRVPKALALLREKRVCLMEFAKGKTLQALIWDRTSGEDLISACELAGKILAQMQIVRTEQICAMPVETLARDLAGAPWHLSSREQTVLESALQNLAGAKVSIGQLYYDYTPENLLFENDQLCLVDPPDVLRHGVLLWDFSCFRGSMRRYLWRFSLRRPFDRRRAIIKRAIALFQRSYLTSFEELYPEPTLFGAATLLFELQRTAVSLTMLKGKVNLARKRMSMARDRLLDSSLASRLMLPLQEMEKRWLFLEKRWLFLQLARELREM